MLGYLRTDRFFSLCTSVQVQYSYQYCTVVLYSAPIQLYYKYTYCTYSSTSTTCSSGLATICTDPSFCLHTCLDFGLILAARACWTLHWLVGFLLKPNNNKYSNTVTPSCIRPFSFSIRPASQLASGANKIEEGMLYCEFTASIFL